MERSKATTWAFAISIVIVSLSTESPAKYGGGNGTPDNPYLICTAEHLKLLGEEAGDWDKHFKLTADIDLKGYQGSDFVAIGNEMKPFSGVFDGAGRSILGFTDIPSNQGRQHDAGLFGAIAKGEVRDLRLIEPQIVGPCAAPAGALAARIMDGAKVLRCNVEGGNISGGWNVGGLAGYNWYATVVDCSARCAVSGINYVGGMVGDNHGDLTKCAFSGSIAGTQANIGGLAGTNYGSITWCEVRADVVGAQAESSAEQSSCPERLGVSGMRSFPAWQQESEAFAQTQRASSA